MSRNESIDEVFDDESFDPDAARNGDWWPSRYGEGDRLGTWNDSYAIDHPLPESVPTSRMVRPSTATSPSKRAPPVPPTITPPRITEACI